MSSKIYIVTDRVDNTQRLVRANSLAGAMRALAEEMFEVRAASAEEVYQSMQRGDELLDALEETPVLPDADPVDVPLALRVAK